jgi:hypothetical protein
VTQTGSAFQKLWPDGGNHHSLHHNTDNWKTAAVTRAIKEREGELWGIE